jgi:hypothetical protein
VWMAQILSHTHTQKAPRYGPFELFGLGAAEALRLLFSKGIYHVCFTNVSLGIKNTHSTNLLNLLSLCTWMEKSEKRNNLVKYFLDISFCILLKTLSLLQQQTAIRATIDENREERVAMTSQGVSVFPVSKFKLLDILL